MRRDLWLLLCAAFLAIGIYGAYSYVDNYAVYRGFPPPRDPVGVKPGKLVRVSFYSGPLHRQDTYLIYEPPGYEAAVRHGARFPVLYLLHGTSSDALHYIHVGQVGVKLDQLLAEGATKPFLVVMPEAEDGTFLHDTEWANTPHGPYESAVLDVVKQVDSQWPTIPKRGARAIGGLSMGGYGAINIWLRHQRTFSIAESWSGYFAPRGNGPFANAPVATRVANNPGLLVAKKGKTLGKRPNHVLLYSGVGDRVTAHQAPFAAALTRAGVSVQAVLVNGSHSWALWRREMPLALSFAGQWFSRV